MDLGEISRDDVVSLVKEDLILREAGRRREVELAHIKARIVMGSPIKPESKMKMSFDVLNESISTIMPWKQDRRTESEKEQDEEQSLEDFYYRTVEAYKKQHNVTEEIENERADQ